KYLLLNNLQQILIFIMMKKSFILDLFYFKNNQVIFGNVAARTSSLRADSQTNKASNKDRYRKACRNREKNKLDKGGCSLTIVTHQDVFNKLEEWAPKQLAYDWDPIGLQVGNVADNTSKILISLDVTDAVVDEA